MQIFENLATRAKSDDVIRRRQTRHYAIKLHDVISVDVAEPTLLYSIHCVE